MCAAHPQKAELEAACIANGLAKTGNAVDLKLRLAMNKIPRQGTPAMKPSQTREPLKQVPAVQPGKKPITQGDLVRVIKENDSYFEEFGKVESVDKGGMMVRFVSGVVVGYKSDD